MELKPEREDPTAALVRHAKIGDRVAWAQLIERYYDSWLRKYHQDLGSTVRRVYDTEDLVQSAVGDAMKDLGNLRNEAAFFSWVTSIIRHKLAKVRRRAEREHRVPHNGSSVEVVAPTQKTPEETVADLDRYTETLEAILEFFPEHPEEMAAVVMKFYDDCDIHELVERFGRPRRTVYRWLNDGTVRLKERLDL